jgi:integrase
MDFWWRHGGDTGRPAMSVLKLTKRSIDALSARNRPFIAFDAELAGFGVRVMQSGVKSWIVEYRPHGGGRSVAKRRVTLGKIGQLTPEHARKAAAEMLAEVRLGRDPAADKAGQRAAPTVNELIDAFVVEHVETKLKERTAEAHAIALDRLRGKHGSLKAGALTRAHLAALHSKMHDRPFAANRSLSVWGKLFSWAGARGLVPQGRNPARGIERYRENGRERYLTGEELGALSDALRQAETIGLPWRVEEATPAAKHLAKKEKRRTVLDPFGVAAIRLLILTGARLREILDSKWSDVDPERGILFLSDSKTGRKPVYLSAAAQAVLAAVPRVEGNPYVIAGANNGAPRADLKKPWRAVTRVARLEGVRLHDLRHSFASFGAGASLGLPIIGKLLGHSQAATTHRYAHLDADPMRRAVETIGATIDAAMNSKRAEIVPFAKTAAKRE